MRKELPPHRSITHSTVIRILFLLLLIDRVNPFIDILKGHTLNNSRAHGLISNGLKFFNNSSNKTVVSVLFSKDLRTLE